MKFDTCHKVKARARQKVGRRTTGTATATTAIMAAIIKNGVMITTAIRILGKMKVVGRDSELVITILGVAKDGRIRTNLTHGAMKAGRTTALEIRCIKLKVF